MEKQGLNEFINDDGTLINSKVKPNINGMSTSNKTTDQSVAMSRQGMVWMNYRRFYGESNESLPYTIEADKCSKDPKKFYYFLKSKNEEKEFNKYFTKITEKKNVSEELKEAAKNKMSKLVEDLITKKREPSELVKKVGEDKITIAQLQEREPILMKKVEQLAEGIKNVFNEEEKEVIIDYFIQTVTL